MRKRAAGYEWNAGKLYRVIGGARKLVPRPSDRLEVTRKVHAQTGHWGARRTTALLATSYWWKGMGKMAEEVTKGCEHCQRVKATFNGVEAQLHPLPIEGFCYRWGVDTAGPFAPITPHGNQYVLIAVEHYTKHVEAIPIPDKESATIAYHFAHNVLARFGSCAEVVTDNGTEFQGEFQELLEKCLIDQRCTTAYHPQANGLAERAVQSIKMALRRMVEGQEYGEHWDQQLPWVLLGYRASVQESTRHSPSQLMYARDPVIPPAVVEKLAAPLELGDPERAAEELLARSAYLKQAGVLVDNYLKIAQHRDTLRYARVKGGAYTRKVTKFQRRRQLLHNCRRDDWVSGVHQLHGGVARALLD